MSNIRKAFQNGKAFVPFVMCGDPDLQTTEKIVAALVRAGSDLIELGMPCANPSADGPIIQRANRRAFRGGATTEKIFDAISRMRKTTTIPLTILTYAEVVVDFGIQQFVKRCFESGVDGLLLPNVPFEQKEAFAEPCRSFGIDFISFVAPTPNASVEKRAESATGFLYCASRLGVTGARSGFDPRLSETISLAKRANPTLPCVVGFGVSTPEQAAEIGALADGVAVGSALVEYCATYGGECVPYVERLVRTIKEALRETKERKEVPKTAYHTGFSAR